MKLLMTVIVFILAMYTSYSQKAPIKFGRLDKEVLEMTVCELDSTAPAVVICDYGYFNGNSYNFTRLMRIKILSKEGYNWANRIFSTYSKSNIRGITYNLVDDEIIEDKLKRSSIYSDHVYDNYYRMRVAMPNVKVGSVIDIEFTYKGLPRDWYFQRKIPVLRSELVIENSVYITFRKNFFGYVPLSESSRNRWVALNVPSFNEEPYMNSFENYISKFEIEIMRVSYPGLYLNFSKTWDGVCHTLLWDYGDFGLPLQAANSFIKKMAKQINKTNTTDKEKVIAALDTLHSIKWNNHEWLYTTERELKFQYDKGVGNSADINIGLIVLLRKLGFEVYPVALSTRSNGLLSTLKPSLEKLNYVVAYAKIDGEFILIDATEELLPYYLLPKRCLNQWGRIIDDDTSVWVSINPTKKYKKVAIYDLSLDDDMTLSGTINYASYDYAAYEQRKRFEVATDEDEFIDNFNFGKEGLIINEATFSNIDDIYKPFKEYYDVTIENSVIQSDSFIYLSLMSYEKIEENLFNSKTRNYPIDFAYPRERSGVISVTLPPGVVVSEMPEPLRLVMPDKSMDYVYSLTQMGNKLILNYRLRVLKSVISISQYDQLKTFYEYIIEKEAEPVVLIIQ